VTAAEQTRALTTQTERMDFLTAHGWEHNPNSHNDGKTWTPPGEPWRNFTALGAVRYHFDHQQATT
jgi:hypothetical protein